MQTPDDRGVFPGQRALSGDGLQSEESIEEGLRREILEELGERLKVTEEIPWTFRDDTRTKTYADGSTEEIHLISECRTANRDMDLNDEFEDYASVPAGEFESFDLNPATKVPLAQRGLI